MSADQSVFEKAFCKIYRKIGHVDFRNAFSSTLSHIIF